MTRPSLLLAASLCVCAGAGCTKEPRPTTAGGHPVSHWTRQLADPDPKHRKQAVQKLGNVGNADPAAAPSVLAALDDRDPQVRCEAILALPKLGAVRAETVTKVRQLAERDPDAAVRQTAERLLAALR